MDDKLPHTHFWPIEHHIWVHCDDESYQFGRVYGGHIVVCIVLYSRHITQRLDYYTVFPAAKSEKIPIIWAKRLYSPNSVYHFVVCTTE